ncbi:MAG: hypothetical protein ACTSSA_15645 [Candidatus Freyarchaeota archaeon]
MSFIKTILRNPLYTGTAYAIEYFIYFSVVPILGASILDNFGLIIQKLDPLMLIIFGAAIAILIFFQKALRRSHLRLSGASGIARYLVSLAYTIVIADMLRFIWVYGSIWQLIYASTMWITVDYSFVIWVVIIAFIVRFVRYSYQIIFARDLQGEKGVETIEEEIREELED